MINDIAAKFLKDLEAQGFEPVAVEYKADRFEPKVSFEENKEVAKRYEVEAEPDEFVLIKRGHCYVYTIGGDGVPRWTYDIRLAHRYDFHQAEKLMRKLGPEAHAIAAPDITKPHF